MIQQRGGPVDGTRGAHGLRLGDPGDRFEAEAARVADAAVSGGRTPVPTPAPTAAAAGPVVQRCGDIPPEACPCHGAGTIQRQQPPGAATGGSGSPGALGGQTFPRPAALPLDQGYELYDLPGLPAEFADTIPEGQMVAIVPVALFEGPGSPAERVTESLGAGAGIGLAMGNAALKGYGLPGSAAGPNSVGIVAIPRANVGVSPLNPLFSLPDPAAPLDYWGHTALYARQGGKIVAVRGFNPATGTPSGIVELLRNFSKIESGKAGVPGALSSDAHLFTSTAARSLEYPVSEQQLARFLQQIPEVGPGGRPGVPSTYSAVPRVYNAAQPPPAQPFCVGSNCGLWAISQVEQGLEGTVGRAGQGSVTAVGSRTDIANQTAIVRLLDEAAAARESAAPSPLQPMRGATGPGVATRVPTVLRVLKIGGRVLLVLGVGVAAYEIATAPPEQQSRVIAGVAGGFAGGFLLGAGAGLVCGPGAPVCSIVAGLTLGFVGSLGGRVIAEGIYDAAAGQQPSARATGYPGHSVVCPSCHDTGRGSGTAAAQGALSPFSPFGTSETSLLFQLLDDATKTGTGTPDRLSPDETEALLSWLAAPR